MNIGIGDPVRVKNSANFEFSGVTDIRISLPINNIVSVEVTRVIGIDGDKPVYRSFYYPLISATINPSGSVIVVDERAERGGKCN